MSKYILPIIVIAQFCCTALWFAGNAVMGDLAINFNLPSSALGHLTSAVQFGFISGTLVFALLAIADRFSPSKVFGLCAFVGALFNLGAIHDGNTLWTLLSLRFMTGFCLAGIYPVGMKIAADYFEKGLGKSLGYLVGALVLGTAIPHLLKGLEIGLPWRQVIMITSGLAVSGGLLLSLLVPNGPFRKTSPGIKLSACFDVFRNKEFRAAAFGYFGHMWELYAFWVFVPMILMNHLENHPDQQINVSLWSFVIIGFGGIACAVGGYLSEKTGPKWVAKNALLLSGLCCFLSPFVFALSSKVLLLSFLIFWGLMVVADSPMFSTLVAQNAPAENKGTALTIVNCVGFAITIVSIQMMVALGEVLSFQYVFILLGIGPVLGLLALRVEE